jgi:hypothetical protein
MAIRWYSIVVDCQDVSAQARWWAAALGWEVVYSAPDNVSIAPDHLAGDSALRQLPAGERGPILDFVPVPEGKQVKNRLHIDLSPGPDDDQAAEVERLVRLGATRIDIGQGEQTWVVLADPEGNEFCVLSPRL